MSWLFGNKDKVESINWEQLNNVDQIADYIAASNEKTVVFFKHSTRCSISSMAKSRFERDWNYDKTDITPVYLDLIAHRDISNALADQFNVTHQSPQIIVVKEGKAVYHNSHNMIDAGKLKDYI